MSETTENIEQNGAAPAQQPSPQWLSFAQAVNQAAQAYGVQAVVLAAAVPTQGSFGPTQINASGWVTGPAPAEWRAGVAPILAQAAGMAVNALTNDAPTAPEAEPEAPTAEAEA